MSTKTVRKNSSSIYFSLPLLHFDVKIFAEKVEVL
jgi:hypothetical protein